MLLFFDMLLLLLFADRSLFDGSLLDHNDRDIRRYLPLTRDDQWSVRKNVRLKIRIFTSVAPHSPYSSLSKMRESDVM